MKRSVVKSGGLLDAARKREREIREEIFSEDFGSPTREKVQAWVERWDEANWTLMDMEQCLPASHDEVRRASQDT